MTSLNGVEATSIIKTDEIGRRKTSAVRREQLLDEYERSGLSGAKFAALTGVKYSTFAAWVQRRRKEQGTSVKAPAQPGEPVRWLEAVVESNASVVGAGLVLQLPGGVRLEMRQANQAGLLVALIRALEKPC